MRLGPLLSILLILATSLAALLADKHHVEAAPFLSLLGLVVLPLVGGYVSGRIYGFKGVLLGFAVGLLALVMFLGVLAFGLYSVGCGGFGCLVLAPLALGILLIVAPSSIALFFAVGAVAGAIVRRRALRRERSAGPEVAEF